MPARDPFAEGMAQLREVRRHPNSPENRLILENLLSSKHNLVVARAADAAADLERHELVPVLVREFDRFLVDPLVTDKTCQAKIAIAGALIRLGGGDAVLLKAVKHVQREASGGDAIDTAAELRAAAAVALAERRHPRALDVAAELLADIEPHARQGAIRALQALPSEGAAALLKFKVLIGDREDEVVADAIKGMLVTDPETLSLATPFLSDRPRLASMTAFSIAEARPPRAFEALRDAYQERDEDAFRAAVIASLGLLRDERCFDLFLEVIAAASDDVALAALAGAAAFVRDGKARERLAKAAASNPAPATRAALESALPA